MRSVPHKLKRTPLASVLATMDEYRHSKRWSREALVQDMVDAHNKINGPEATGIEYVAPVDPKDIAGPQKINAERVYRWMDETKDRNLLPFNAHIAVYGGLPIDSRIKLMNELYNPIGVVVRPIEAEAVELKPLQLLQRILKECAEAQHAIAGLADGFDSKELSDAHLQVSEAIDALLESRKAIENLMSHR